MTTPIPDNPNELPLDELAIVPEWARATPKSYEHHPGEREDRRGRDRGFDRPPGHGGDRDRRPRRPEGGSMGPGGRPPRSGGAPRSGQGGSLRSAGPRREGDRPRPATRPMDRAPQPPVAAPEDVQFLPDEKGFAAMLGAMKHSHRAYALFDVAKLVLNKPERHAVRLTTQPAADGARPPLFQVVGDENVFLSQDEALRYVLRRPDNKLCGEEKKPVDPPKGNFTYVNRCGITGVIFGPPNYHEYQTLIVRHHQRRLRHLPFEDFKARIQTTTDPAAIKQWVESKSFVTEHRCLLCPEPKTFAAREELEKHIAETHLDQLIIRSTDVQMSGLASRQQSSPGIAEAVRLAWLSERRFPLKTAQTISERLRSENFHFFKHGKGVTFVTFVKPKRFETLDGLSEQVQKIITFLRAHPDSPRKRLLENLLTVAPPVPVANASVTDAGTVAVATVSPEDRVFADLHWLIQDGYVVEFADGKLQALENRPPKPPPPQPAARPAAEPVPSAPPPPVAATPASPSSATESTVPTEAPVTAPAPAPDTPVS